jgi:hypothetical protein
MRPEPRKEGLQSPAVFLWYDHESQPESAPAFYVTNDSLRFDAAFLNQKVQFGRHAFLHLEVRSLNEQPIDTDIEDPGDVVAAIANPADPDVFRGGKTREGAPGIGWFPYQERLPGALARC